MQLTFLSTLALTGPLLLFLARTPVVANPPPTALDWGFRFATALQSDFSDQTRAQAAVATEYVTIGNFPAATNAVEQILDWRRVTGWADIAAAQAWRGDTNAATVALQRTEQLLPGVRGDWQPARASAHLAVALAASGDLARARERIQGLPIEEAIKVRVALARQLAADGNRGAAEAELRPAQDSKSFVVDAGLVAGWLAIGGVTTNELPALHAARDLHLKLPVGKQAELAGDLAVVLHTAGDTAGASNLLESTVRILEPAEPYVRAPGLVRCAQAWGRIGQPARQTELLKQAAEIARTGDPLDQPAAAAVVAGALAAAGQTTAAWELYDHGLQVASGFVNARPRVLAIVELCLSIGRQQLPLTAEWQTRLEKLFAELGDPW